MVFLLSSPTHASPPFMSSYHSGTKHGRSHAAGLWVGLALEALSERPSSAPRNSPWYKALCFTGRQPGEGVGLPDRFGGVPGRLSTASRRMPRPSLPSLALRHKAPQLAQRGLGAGLSTPGACRSAKHRLPT